MKRRVSKALIIVLTIFVVGEVVLRFLGFHTPVLYKEDATFEYIYAPNQQVHRFGLEIKTNEYCMRSAPLQSSDSIRILKIGDSIINGGSQTSNDSLASSLLEAELSEKFSSNIRVLNVSAGSWGPENVVNYLQKYGTFGAELMVYVFNSEDYDDNMTFNFKEGEVYFMPAENPPFAWYELIHRYLWPRIKTFFGWSYYKGLKRSPPGMSPGWQKLIDISRSKGIPLIAYQHPKLVEVEDQEYEPNGLLASAFLDSSGVHVINGMPFMRPEFYRDEIHLNDAGQRHLKQAILPYLEDFLTTGKLPN